MILLADSGSTKTEWKAIEGEVPSESIFSSGINPYFLGSEQIIINLKKEVPSLEGKPFDSVFFYGTGCNSEAREKVIRDALDKYLKSANIFIGSDLLGAARALCGNEPGIACIMGTGSNSCYYDGKKIAANVAPLGYILGDEGGAAVLGKKLLSAVLKKQMSEAVINRFYETFNITRIEILENVYTRPFPNRFLGSFAKFISANIEMPELQEIVRSSFNEFIRRNILQYPESADYPVHFTGSISWYFRPLLLEQLEKNGLRAGKIILHPMQELVKYHINNIKK